MNYYTLSDFVDFAVRQLEIEPTKRDVVEGMVLLGLRELPMSRFVEENHHTTLYAVDGRVDLPVDVYRVRGNHPFLTGTKPGDNYLMLPRHVNSIELRYDRLPTDADGLPLIPEAFDKALMLYIDAEYVMKARWRTAGGSANDYVFAQRLYNQEVGRVRGRVNALSDAENYNLIRMRQNILARPTIAWRK